MKATRDPERTRQRILDAAIAEFSEKGLKGGRIVSIARRARTNYQALYYHFGNKEKLYAAALETVITLQDKLNRFNIPVEEIGPVAALARLIDGIFDAYFENIRHMSLLHDENMHQARHIDEMPAAKQLMEEVLALTADILERGAREGVLRGDLEPARVYMSIAGLASSYMSNIPMNSRLLGRDFAAPEEIAAWRAHVATTLLSGFCTHAAKGLAEGAP